MLLMRLRPLVLPLTLFLLAGCLPHSCQPRQAEALFPADSLSRERADEVPVDTLRLVWRGEGGEEEPMETPYTVQFGPDERVYVSDTERHSVFAFRDNGQFSRYLSDAAFERPLLAGMRGDTLLVLNPQKKRLDFIVENRRADSLRLPMELPEDGAQVWATTLDDAFFVKVTGADTSGYVARFNRRGQETARRMLPPPAWRRAGRLRPWDGRLLSLSHYRPVVDVLPADLSDAAELDTLALIGFDSPMLGRSRSFVQGEVNQPPLLIESAASAGAWLFVLNMRPGWLRIDVFDREGQLVRRLTQAEPSYSRDFYPRDLAVRERPDGAFDLAIVFTHPEPVLELYRWRPQELEDEQPAADRSRESQETTKQLSDN